ncbi:MAG TPA: hypothetical protein VFP61_02340 [Acidimicrobiales bacterium]|nr:hypothetical protein [Acidimicrobiales bacterium]
MTAAPVVGWHMAHDELKLQYFLTTTAVQFSGTVTATVTADAGAHAGLPTVRRDGTAAVLLRADAIGPVELDLERTGLADSDASLSFTPDGRLTSASAATTGTGSAVIAAVSTLVGVGAEVAKDVGGGRLMEVARTTKGTRHREHHPEAVEQLAEVKSSQAKAVDALIGLAARLDAPATGDGDELDRIDKALTLLAAQRARLEAEAAAATTVTTASRTFVLDARQLPTEAELLAGLEQSGRQAAAEVWSELGISATLERPVAGDPPVDRSGVAPFQAGAATRLWYRRPRRSTLSVWRQVPDDPTPQLVTSYDLDVFDEHCEHVGLPFSHGRVFGSETISVTLAADGTLATLGEKVTGGVSEVAGALAGIAGGIGGGIKDASGVITALTPATPASPDAQAVIDLTATRDRLKLEQEIATLRTGGH